MLFRSNIDAYIYDDPYMLFEAQCDGTIAKTDIGKNTDSVLTTGSTVNGQSKNEIDDSTEATTAGLQVKRSEERRVGKECRSRWWTDH